MSKVKQKKDDTDKKVCTRCNKNKSIKTDYYQANHPFYSDGRYGVCKSCIRELIADVYSIESVKNILRMLDLPYLPDVYKTSLEEAHRRNMDVFGMYMKNIGMQQYKDLTYDDSILTDTQEPEINDDIVISVKNRNSLELPDMVDLQRYWGKGYTLEEYKFLEEEKFKLMASFECPDYGMEMIMRDICFINLDIENLRSDQKNKSITETSKLIKMRSDLMNDAKMKPIQATGSEANDQLTFGVLIKKWENEKPVPKALDDEMKTYIDTFMVGHLAKMEGLSNELTEKYDKALSEYTIDFKDVNAQELEDE